MKLAVYPDWLEELSATQNGQIFRERFLEALERGVVEWIGENKFTLSKSSSGFQPQYSFVQTEYKTVGPCKFLNRFMYDHIYKAEKLPYGCKSCFKVRVVAKRIVDLVLLRKLSLNIPCLSKWGTEEERTKVPGDYAGYFYAHSEEQANSVKEKFIDLLLLNKIDPTAFEIYVKRGCSKYENSHALPATWSFERDLLKVEELFFSHFIPPTQVYSNTMDYRITLLNWMNVAKDIGDETYKELMV